MGEATPGWIGELFANATGERVRKGERLFTLYSPELYAAQQELMTALASQEVAQKTSIPDRADYLKRPAPVYGCGTSTIRRRDR